MQDPRDLFDREALVHLAELLRVCTRLVNDRTLAEDLVQETFLQGWRSFARYRAGTNCRAWLYRIMFLLLADHRRREARAPTLMPFDDDAVDVASAASSLGFTTPENVRSEDVRAAFERLPEPFRVVTLLADVEGHSYREIAEELAIPIGTVMSRLNRARRKLRADLAAGQDSNLRVFRKP